MKKNILTRWLFATLLLVSSMAGAEQKYPAADFEPVIIFQDAGYIAKNSPAIAPTAPSASDKQDISSQSSTPSVPIEPVKTDTAEATLEKPDDLSMGSYQAGLIVLVLAGLIFWSVSPKPE